jgi:hypothetical protein
MTSGVQYSDEGVARAIPVSIINKLKLNTIKLKNFFISFLLCGLDSKSNCFLIFYFPVGFVAEGEIRIRRPKVLSGWKSHPETRKNRTVRPIYRTSIVPPTVKISFRYTICP